MGSTCDAEYDALTQLQAEAFVTLDADLARRVEGMVATASIEALCRTWIGAGRGSARGEDDRPRAYSSRLRSTDPPSPGAQDDMDADAFRHFYDYHFSENRNTWDAYITALSDEQFTRDAGYSHGSIRNQVVHLLSVDDTWFSSLRGVEPPDSPNPAGLADRDRIRAHWDAVEQRMREYLADLRDAMLFEKPFAEGEDKDLILWQVLLHVANHGTDHRAQLLRSLNDLGVKTVSQDYIFYVYDHP